MKYYESIEEKRVELRKKYADGYVSDYYMRTGIPQVIREKTKQTPYRRKRRPLNKDYVFK